jgi:hypothetical protein
LNQPAADNPWLNQTATHPFSVFNDFNHESLRTRYFTSRVVEHWLTEYKIDGFRFDLSKGFTQVNSGANVGLWGNYDASRVAIWKRYYDSVQLKSAGAYVILEHFADNNEEIELSNYGMLLWGNNSYQYGEAAMGYLANSNFENNLFTVRNWTKPHLIGYMESHDEERLMYKNLQFGNSSGAYSIRTLSNALRRIELTSTFFLMMPGPKMIWQFGELGYDYSINTCTDGTVNNNCRLDKKPIRWDYQAVPERKKIFTVMSQLNALRAHPLFKSNFMSNRVVSNLAGGIKWMQLTTDTSNIMVIGNFDVASATGTITFPSSGIWYDYFTSETFVATGGTQQITLAPGDYKVYINRNIFSTGGGTGGETFQTLSASVNPNPAGANTVLQINLPSAATVQAHLYNSLGQRIAVVYNSTLGAGKQVLPINEVVARLSSGVYYINISNGAQHVMVKMMIL